VCGTIALRRSRFPFRKAFVVSSTEDLTAQLETFAQSGCADPIGEARSLRTAFILTGQGSQWAKNGVELMEAFPTYRKTAEVSHHMLSMVPKQWHILHTLSIQAASLTFFVCHFLLRQAVDRQFAALARWSLLDKIATLSTDDMLETKFAQPITFLVQVALLETLKHFSIFPDLVIGHSAGEVAAAYASGLLTLEEAVQVVYHRSCEQQKLAGSGRMLAVGLASERVLELIKGKPELELACVNSPQSTVVAGPEDQLTALKGSLPPGTTSTFVPGNIAFHSSRCQPILEPMRKRLAFLDARSTSSWSVPLVSTVTGKVVTATPAQYWADNVRRPVLFQTAVEAAFRMNPAPEVVVEVGPHRTLVGPTMQTIQAMGCEGKDANVVSLLNRKESNALTFLQALGTLFEAGVEVDFDLHFREHVQYEFEEDLPKHPYVKKSIRGGRMPVLFYMSNVSTFEVGPVAGSHRILSETYSLELCDRTAKAMCNHKMGGEAVVPGAFYSEMVLEGHNHLPVTLVNVEYKAKLAIPKASVGDDAALVVLDFKEEQDGVKSFAIRSCASRDKHDERPIMVEHCSGKIVKNDCLTPEDTIRAGPIPGAHGSMGKLELKDLGKEGLAALRAAHAEVQHDSKESFYETYAQEGRNEYIDNYQLTTGLWVDPVGATVLARLEHDNTAWVKEGGKYTAELLDNITHVSLYSGQSNIIYYAGGYEAAHFLRLPETSTLWVHWRPDEYMTQVGRKKISGDFLLYDDHGRLLVHIHKYFYIFHVQSDTYKLCTLDWQPAGVVTPQAVLASALQGSLVNGLEAWGPFNNHQMTAWLAKQLSKRGIISIGSRGAPLMLTDLAANAPDEAITLPQAAKLGERIEAILDALGNKIKAAKAEEADEDGGVVAEGKDVELTEEEVAELRQVGRLQRAEADAVADGLLALAQAEHMAHMNDDEAMRVGGSDTRAAPFVLRVLEVVEDEVLTVVERLSYLDLPSHLQVECFIASHSAAALRAVARNFNQRASQVVLRKVLLSEGHVPAALLKDLTFQALILDDWARTGRAAWSPAQEDKEDQGAIKGVPSPAATALALLKPFLAPSAQVLVRGMASEPAWVGIMSQLSTKPLVLLEDAVKQESGEVLAQELEGAAQEWTTALGLLGAQPVEKAGGLLLVGRLPATRSVPASRVVLVASTEEQVQAVRRTAADTCVEVDVLMLTEESTVESLEAELAKVLGAERNGGDSGTEETKSSSESESNRGEAWRISSIIFTAGLDDESVIGQVAFSRLLRLSQALMRSQEGLSRHLSPIGEGPSLWVVTQGVYGGNIRPNQSTLQGMSAVLCSGLRLVGTKHLDLATMDDLEVGIELCLSNAREQAYRVSDGRISVARFCSLDRDELRRTTILPSSKQSFFVDTSAGELALTRCIPQPPAVMAAFYRLCELPAPGDDEVQIDVHAAAVNFRDVMVALHMLAEKSFEVNNTAYYYDDSDEAND
jgi:malonyl CoA-acyl carrier protein transacylase